jgi:hypothetical protein
MNAKPAALASPSVLAERCGRCIAWWLAMTLLMAAAVAENGATPESPRQSIIAESLESTPWYDAEDKRLTPLPVQVREDDSINRDSRWLPRPEQLTEQRPVQTSSGSSGNSGGLFGSSLTLGHLFGWALLIALVLAVAGGIVYAISRAELGLTDRKPDAGKSGKKGLPDKQTLERIKHLPAELRRTDVNLRSECERLMGQGLYEQAIILLLGHQLLLLDRAGVVRLSRGKTNGTYVREARSRHDQCGFWLRQTADAFEQSYFGRHEIAPEVFAELWRQNEQLEAALDIGEGVIR